MAIINKSVLIKLLCYKAGALAVTILVAYAFTGKWMVATKVGIACELATLVYYYCFECVWRGK